MYVYVTYGECVHMCIHRTDDEVEIYYAYYMLGASLLSLFSEYVIWGPIINEDIRIIRNWMDRLDVLGVCFLSALICFWIEDVSTIYLFFKVEGVFDRGSIADMMNLFASLAAGCLGLVSLLILPFFISAGKFGAFNKELSCGKRCCNCFDCLGFYCLSSSQMTRQERKEHRQKSCGLFIVMIFAIIATAYPSYIAFFEIYLGRVSDVECKDRTFSFWSDDAQDRIVCDWLEDTSMCIHDDIRRNCQIFCNSCDEVFEHSDDDIFNDSPGGISDVLLILSVGLGLLWLIAGIVLRIKYCCKSAKDIQMEEDTKMQDRIDRWHGVERQQITDRQEENPQIAEC